MIILVKNREKIHFDKYAIDRKFEQGERVLVYKESLKSLEFNWDGPFRVVKYVGNNTYVLENGNKKQFNAYGGNLFKYNAEFSEKEENMLLKKKDLLFEEEMIENTVKQGKDEIDEIKPSTKRSKELEEKQKEEKKKNNNIYKKNFKTQIVEQDKEEKKKNREYYKEQEKILKKGGNVKTTI